MNRRIFNRQLFVGLSSSLIRFQPRWRYNRRSLIIDADTGNEVDDLFAIVGAVLEPNLEIVGLTAAQYHTSPQAPKDSVGDSDRINKDILALLEREDVPALEGSNHPMVNQWRPQRSAAADFIIEEALKMQDGKLDIAILGPCTNIASAILLEPEIIDKIAVYYLGFWHDPKQNTWSKREFNTNNDPSAVDCLLNNSALEFHVMTATTSQNLVFEKAVVDQHLKGKGGIADYLVNRWENYHRWWQRSDSQKNKWVMWDVALLEALAHPHLSSQKQFVTPHDNLQRMISVYTDIDAVEMEKRYWEKLDEFLS